MSGRLYANIYAGFILLKKCARFKNRMWGKFVSYKNIDGKKTTIVSEKNVVWVAGFPFHICR